MSESAKDPKVEDVLSSVRRLVSGELPRKPRTELPDGPGALVLTDAHRVEQGARARVASKSLEERIAELEAAISDRSDDDFEPDGSEDQSQHRPDRIVYTRPPSAEDEANVRRSTLRLSQIAVIETGPANDESDADDLPAFRHEAPPEAPMAEDVPVLSRRSAEVKAFSNPDDVVQRLEARIDSRSVPAPTMPSFVPKPEAREEAPPSSEPAVEETTTVASGAESGDSLSDLLEEDGFFAEETSGFSDDEPGFGPSDDDSGETSEGEEEDPDLAFENALSAAVAASMEEVAEEMSDRVEISIEEIDLELSGEPFPPEPVVEDTDESPDDAVEAPPVSGEEALADVQGAVDGDLPPEAELTATPAPETAESPETVPAAVVDEPESEPPAAEEMPSFADENEVRQEESDIVDEDEMRQIVARLIREELQGELGERITRNVRKLVRREIMRAMSSQDLE